MTAKNKSEVPRVDFLKKKIDWDNPEKGLLNSINAFYQTTSRGLPRGVWKKEFLKALTGGVCFCVRSFVRACCFRYIETGTVAHFFSFLRSNCFCMGL